MCMHFILTTKGVNFIRKLFWMKILVHWISSSPTLTIYLKKKNYSLYIYHPTVSVAVFWFIYEKNCAPKKLLKFLMKMMLIQCWWNWLVVWISPTCSLKDFTLKDPKSANRQSSHQYLSILLGSAYVKAAHKMLMKLTPGVNITDIEKRAFFMQKRFLNYQFVFFFCFLFFW